MPETKIEGAGVFGVNTYSYTFDWGAADCVRRLSDQGYRGVELMMYPGHLWPGGAGAAKPAEVRRALDETGLPVVAVNMPNIDINIAGASDEMRAYSLGLLTRFIEVAGEVGAPTIILGPGKANPLFAPPREMLLGHFRAALDRLAPVAKKAGVRILVENMPFAFLPRAQEIMAALDDYGNDEIGVIYDVANAHFVGEDPGEGLRIVRKRLGLVHFSDTTRAVYRHDTVGLGDVPFATVPAVLKEIEYLQMPVLEVISRNADADTRESAARLAALGYV